MNKTLLAAAAALPLLLLSACSDDDKDPVEITVRLNQTPIEYTQDNVWAGVAANDPFQSQYALFSHEGEDGPWGLVWRGFTPARVSDTSVQSDWLSHQFQILTGGGISGPGTPYIVCFWDTQENESTPAADRSCRITYQYDPTTEPLEFRPQSVYVQNTAYAYYTMVDGSPWSKKFDATDWLKLTAHGVHADGTEAEADFYLAKDGKYAEEWTLMDLTALGSVKEMYFTLTGSDTGQWGLNTPSYFAIDALSFVAVLPKK